MKTLIIYSSSSTFRPRSVVASLASDQQKLGHQVVVLDVSEFSYVTQDLPPRWFARIFGHRVFPNALERFFLQHNIEFVKLSRRGEAANRPVPEDIEADLDDAVFSELVTYVLTDAPDYSDWFTAYSSRKIKSTATPLYWEMIEFLEGKGFQRVLIPNGRVADQRLALLACKNSALDIEFYEIGRAVENSYYFGTQQVHDREGTQSEVEEKTSHLSPNEIEKLADAWLETRMTTGLAIHPYNKNWETSEEVESTTNRASESLAVFFSSSVDEFASYGGSWRIDSWQDQFQAFEAIIPFLEEKGVRCILRLHPNLINKGKRYFDKELERVRVVRERFPNLEILTSTDPTNSYDLLKRADYVIVGRSTLGLEASCMGKAVWATTAARYDEIADVRKVLNPKEVKSDLFSLWSVDSFPAKKFVSYWVTQDQEFSVGEDQWSTWDSMRAPLWMKIGNLFVRNSLPHKIHLIRLEFLRARNRRLAKRFGGEVQV